MMVWQSSEGNEWDVAIRHALAEPHEPAVSDSGYPDPFSLADRPTVNRILVAAGFAGVAFAEVSEPVYHGPDVSAALAWVRGFTCTSRVLNRLDPEDAVRAVDRLRETLATHLNDDGIWFDSRAWIVTAHRR